MVFKKIGLDPYLLSSELLTPLKSGENVPIWHLLIFTSTTSYTIPFHTLWTVSIKFPPVRDTPISTAPSTAPGLDSWVLPSRFWFESIWLDAKAVTYRHFRIQAGLGPLRSTPELAQFHFYIYWLRSGIVAGQNTALPFRSEHQTGSPHSVTHQLRNLMKVL